MPSYFYRHRGVAGQLTRPETLIGRSDECAIRVDQSKVSRVHALLRLTPDGVEIVDLGSMNGTRVNGQRLIGPRPLSSGDVIQIGLELIEIEIASGSADTSLAPPTTEKYEAVASFIDTLDLVEAIVAGPDVADRPEDTARMVRALLGNALELVTTAGSGIDSALAERVLRVAGVLRERMPSELVSSWCDQTVARVKELVGPPPAK